jgi:SAM-dependent methyltransferase
MFKWNSVATTFNEVPENRFEILSPIIRNILSSHGIYSLVDHGGGDGRFLAWLLGSNKKPDQLDLALFEPSESMLEMAQKRWSPQIPVVGDASLLPQGSWDAVLQVAVWMCLHDENACLDMLAEVKGLLKPGGLFIAAVTHPCFRPNQFGTFKADFDQSDYHRNGHPFDVEIGAGNETMRITDYHWNLEAMTHQLAHTGFQILRMYEPRDLDTQSIGVPWLIIEAQSASG